MTRLHGTASQAPAEVSESGGKRADRGLHFRRASALRVLSSLALAGGIAGCITRITDDEPFYIAADAGIFGGTNGGGSGSGSGGLDASYPNCDAPTEVFGPVCILCHAPPSPLGDLDLSSPDLPSRLVGVESELCSGHVLATPSAPAQSYLVQKMAEATPACGHQMPENGIASTKEITCVIDWIANLGVDAGMSVAAGGTTTGGTAGGLGTTGSSTTGDVGTTGGTGTTGHGTTGSSTTGHGTTGGGTTGHGTTG